MNNNVDIPALKERYATVVAELDNYYDPIDKIEHLGNFIKELLKAYGTNEVLLATPLDIDSDFIDDFLYEEEMVKNEEYESDKLELETLIKETADQLKQDQTIQWTEPVWIYEHPTGLIQMEINHDNFSVWFQTLIVRIGIVDDTVKFTWQQHQSDCLDDICMTDYEKETDWLKIGNMAALGIETLIKLVDMLLSCPKIWKYTFKYPQFHKLKE